MCVIILILFLEKCVSEKLTMLGFYKMRMYNTPLIGAISNIFYTKSDK